MSDAPDRYTGPLFDEFEPVGTDAWWARVDRDLKGKSRSALTWHPDPALEARPFYRNEDLDDLPAALKRTPVVTYGNGWSVRQDVPYNSGASFPQEVAQVLDQGVHALGLELGGPDGLPTLEACNAAWAAAVPYAPSVHITAHSHPLLGYLAVADMVGSSKMSLDGLFGSIDDDLLAQGLVRGHLPSSEAWDALALLAREASVEAPSLRVLALDGRMYHEAGATTVQTLGCQLAALSTLLDQLTDRGLDVPTLVRQTHVIVPVGTSYFTEIARFRAIRSLISNVLLGFDPEGRVDGQDVLLQARTSRWHQTRYAPLTNALRGTTAAAAAVLGGCDVLHVEAYDAIAGASPRGVRLARNTQHLLRDEAYLGAVADPAAGSYYIETLTHQVAEAAWDFFTQIEQRGGWLQVVESGWLQETLQASSTEALEALHTRKRVVVGSNQYPDEDEPLPRSPQPTTDGPPTGDAFTDLSLSMEALREALGAQRTFNAIHDALETAVWSQNVQAVPQRRWTEAFEALRDRVEAHVAEGGKRPVVILLLLGPPRMRSARAQFAVNLFGCANFDVRELAPFEDPVQAARAALDEQADLVVLCSDDASYEALVSAITPHLKEATPPPRLVVAGAPSDDLSRAGADDFVHRHIHVLDTLTHFAEHLGLTDEA